MAEKSGSEQNAVRLREKIEHSRELVVRDLGGMRYELNFPLKFRKAFQRHTVLWVGSALALGLLLALMRARTKKVYINPAGKKVGLADKRLLESGALLGLLKLGITLVQPMVAGYLAKKGGRKGDRQGHHSSGW
jgi:hypothetical protein